MVECVEVTGWTLHYIETLDPAHLREFMAAYQGYRKVMDEIKAGKFKPSGQTLPEPDPVPLQEEA